MTFVNRAFASIVENAGIEQYAGGIQVLSILIHRGSSTLTTDISPAVFLRLPLSPSKKQASQFCEKLTSGRTNQRHIFGMYIAWLSFLFVSNKKQPFSSLEMQLIKGYPMRDVSCHPCFNAQARHRCGRMHMPVAPLCNVQCNFCDRKYCCVNESRPGVSAAVISPAEALRFVDDAMARMDDLVVVGIAGPGDPFANSRETLETLRLVRDKYPELLLCVSSNGLDLAPHVDALAAIGVSHVTVTVNGVDPAIIEKIYSWVSNGAMRIRGREAAQFLIDRQHRSVETLHRAGILIKINTVVIPGINDMHVAETASTMAGLGVQIQNCIPLIPVKNTLFGDIAEPGAALINRVRRDAGMYLPQMSHCTRCRADACGLVGEDCSIQPMFEKLLLSRQSEMVFS